MTKKIMTAEEYIRKSVLQYPSLYAGGGWRNVKLKVLDHVFNTIGNGVELEHFAMDPVEDVRIDKLIDASELAYAYPFMRTCGGIIRGDGDFEVIMLDEIQEYKYKGFVYFMEFNVIPKYSPYPNFRPQYTSIYPGNNLAELLTDESWRVAARMFYSACEQFFQDDERVREYNHAFPSNNPYADRQQALWHLGKFMTLGSVDAVNDYYKGDVKFEGSVDSQEDIYNFFCRRWEAERVKNIQFCSHMLKDIIGEN